jgi:hypothetical protein
MDTFFYFAFDWGQIGNVNVYHWTGTSNPRLMVYLVGSTSFWFLQNIYQKFVM